MTKRIILLGLACGLLAGSTGCKLLGCLLCPTASCNPQHCAPAPGPACGPSCGPAYEPTCGPPAVAPCEPACGMAAAPTCDAPYGSPYPCGPLTWLFRLFEGAGCYGGGCGETYYGDWCSDPPDCCDPCDRLGNYTGGGVSGYGGVGGYGGVQYPSTVPQGTGVAPAPAVTQRPRTIRR